MSLTAYQTYLSELTITMKRCILSLSYEDNQIKQTMMLSTKLGWRFEEESMRYFTKSTLGKTFPIFFFICLYPHSQPQPPPLYKFVQSSDIMPGWRMCNTWRSTYIDNQSIPLTTFKKDSTNKSGTSITRKLLFLLDRYNEF